MRRFHSAVGWTVLLVFLATGLYLRDIFPSAYQNDDSIRYLFRANHVYILFSGLLSILASLLLPFASRYPRLHTFASVLIIAAPFLFVTAFITETAPASPMRPLTVTGAFACLTGVLLLVFTRFRSAVR